MTNTGTFTLSDSRVTCRLGVMHLRRYWEKAIGQRTGQFEPGSFFDEWNTDNALLAALGLGLEQTIVYIYNHSGDFKDFENWILQVLGGAPDPVKVEAFNHFILEGTIPATGNEYTHILSPQEWEQWNREGYVIVRDAVSKQDCEATIALICAHLGIDRYDPSTWYREHTDRQGIMVQLFQHPQLQKNRTTPKIRQVYEQLWGRTDIQVNTDRVGFNPPETGTWSFPGPRMHWDVSLKLPIPFGTQGILYLADTATNQGAFTLVPGFHLNVEEWLAGLPPGASPRDQDIEALGPMPIAANAGDLIIWHHALPHGSSPNTSSLPRFVQYMNYAPAVTEVWEEWV